MMHFRWIIFSILLLSACTLQSQIEFADVILDAFYSGVNPEFNNFYGNNGTSDGCNLFDVEPDVCLGDNDNIVCLPEGSYITIGFLDNLVFDADGQDDLFIQEQGGGQEFGEVWVSPDGINFTFLDGLNGAQVNSYDLSDYPYDDVIKAVKIVGLDQGGCNPGLDLQRIFGLAGANCLCGAQLEDFPTDICESDTIINLKNLVLDDSDGVWTGPNVTDSIFNPMGLTETAFELYYLVNYDHPVCPVDTVTLKVNLADCDCNGILNGGAELDECGDCRLPSDPNYNANCTDCAGVVNGAAVVDSCGICLTPTHEEFNTSCLDCEGTFNGTARIDLCGECLQPDDPSYNSGCDEIFRVYMPNIFDLRSHSFRGIGPSHNDGNIGFLKYFEVYDRWGNKMYGINNIPLRDVASWWDGRYGRNELTSGVYSYRLWVEYEEAEDIMLESTITIIN